MGEIVNFISSLGFPVACVVACAYYIIIINRQSREDTKAREERMYSQLEKFSSSLDNFNETLVRIDTRLATVEKNLDE